MKKTIAALALTTGLAFASASQAAITVDGILDAEYGGPTGMVAYDIAAPTSNFDAPTGASNAIGYSIYLSSDADNVYGYLKTSGPGTSAGPFANLYFDLDSTNGYGSDVMFEITNNKLVIGAMEFAVPITSFASLNVVEFAISKSIFSTILAGAPAPNADSRLTLRMSQSFGYSVAGAGGDTGLGALAVPEPSTWAMMILGLGAAGAVLRRRNAALAAA